GQCEDGSCQRADGDEGNPAWNPGLSSRPGHRHGVEGGARQERQEIQGRERSVSEEKAPARARGVFVAAIGGGIIGSLLTAAALFFALPDLLSSRIVRQ